MKHTRPVRVALIGYGFAGRTFHVPLIQSVPGLSLALVASSSMARVRGDLPDVVVDADPIRAATSPDVDLVVVAAPNAAHFSLAGAALQAGKHVVIDKPMTPRLDEALELASLAEANARLLSVFHNRRWDSDFLSVAEAVRRGAIGEIQHFESRMERFRPEVRERWREQAGPASGLWWDLGPHLVDQALLLMGWPDAVQANISMQRRGAITDDWAHVVLEFGARRAVLHAGMLAAAPAPRFIVHGTTGSLLKQKADPQEQQLLAGLRPGDAQWGKDPDPLLWVNAEGTGQALAPARGDQSQFYVGLCKAITGEGGNPVPSQQSLRVMRVLEAAADSALERRVVQLSRDS